MWNYFFCLLLSVLEWIMLKDFCFFLYLWYKNTLLVLTYTLLYLGERAERNLVIFYRPFCYSNLIYNMEIRSVSQSQHLICAHWKCVTVLHFETFYPGSKPEIKTLFNVFCFFKLYLTDTAEERQESGEWEREMTCSKGQNPTMVRCRKDWAFVHRMYTLPTELTWDTLLQ